MGSWRRRARECGNGDEDFQEIRCPRPTRATSDVPDVRKMPHELGARVRAPRPRTHEQNHRGRERCPHRASMRVKW